jgi:hypothetical protein
MSNLRFYEAGRHVPQEAQKSFNNGRFSGTDINPMWRIKKLTELFGPAGIGWYTEVLSERSEKLLDDSVIAVVDLNLYVKVDGEWSKPIYGTGGNALVSTSKKGVQASDEGYKMAYTDALGVACKALGIGADVYFEKDKTKYAQQEAPAPRQAPGMATQEQIDWLSENASVEQCQYMTDKYGLSLEKLTFKQAEKFIDQIKGASA